MAFRSTALIWAMLAFSPSLASAQGLPLPADQIIATRQGGMALTGSVTELMKAGVTSGADVKMFEAPAAALAEWGKAFPGLFPEGTQTGNNTKAKAAIWSDRADFNKKAADFVAASVKLAEAAKSGDKAAFAAAFTAEGQSCGGCHRNYKER